MWEKITRKQLRMTNEQLTVGMMNNEPTLLSISMHQITHRRRLSVSRPTILKQIKPFIKNTLVMIRDGIKFKTYTEAIADRRQVVVCFVNVFSDFKEMWSQHNSQFSKTLSLKNTTRSLLHQNLIMTYYTYSLQHLCVK